MPRTRVSIEGDRFLIDGKPTFEGTRIEGLLMNARLVQGIFDDRNPETRRLWDYPDGPWDPERNTREFIAAMPEWRRHGLVSFTINLQGGSPQGYSRHQPWRNSAITPDGSLREESIGRLQRILDRADELGMVPILGIFYFGQEPHLEGERAVEKAVANAVEWVRKHGYRNVLVEIANECDIDDYRSEILKPARAHELIEFVRSHGLLAGTSLKGGSIPPDNVIAASDFVLLHGNGVGPCDEIARMVDKVRRSPAYRDQPILFNEDDHFDFDQPQNHLLAAVERGAGWGYFDYRMGGEG
ncbi:MAG TPA: hypothetical protein VGE01_03100, partial [Fimbriimonas sp.]